MGGSANNRVFCIALSDRRECFPGSRAKIQVCLERTSTAKARLTGDEPRLLFPDP